MKNAIRYLSPERFLTSTVAQEELDQDLHDHGNCLASKVTGPTYQVAKRAQVMMISLRLPETWLSELSNAIATIDRDVMENRLNGKATLNLSISYPTEGSRLYGKSS